MNIYEINSGEGKTWVCANTNIHALRKYSDITGTILFELDDSDYIRRLDREEWTKFQIYDEEDLMSDGESHGTTFEEYMKGEDTCAHIICSTIY